MKYVTTFVITAALALAFNSFAATDSTMGGSGNSAAPGSTGGGAWDGEIDLTDPAVAADDFDSDGIANASDNCLTVANADQRDTDGDGFGNACDADLDNDCIVQCSDATLMQSAFYQTGDLDADLNGDEVVNFLDLVILRDAFFTAPGPSGQPNICD